MVEWCEWGIRVNIDFIKAVSNHGLRTLSTEFLLLHHSIIKNGLGFSLQSLSCAFVFFDHRQQTLHIDRFHVTSSFSKIEN